MFAVVVLAAAWFAGALVEESGYNCTIGHVPVDAGSVYRLLPWGRTERLFFLGHIVLYPIATLIGGAAGEAWYGSRPATGCSGLLIATPVLAVVAFVVQLRVTAVFMHLDACGSGYYMSQGLARLLGVEIAITVIVAFVVGIFSWLSASLP